jgi:hypothetical protein
MVWHEFVPVGIVAVMAVVVMTIIFKGRAM